VSSYGRNAFTRGTLCLCLVRSPLYTSAAATCSGSPHLRHRSSDPALDMPHLFGHLARAAAGPGRDVPGLRTAFMVLSNLRRRRQAPPGGAIPAQQSSHSIRSISVFVSTRTAKVSPRGRNRARTESRRCGRTRVRLPKTNFPNSISKFHPD
jgi:hypothetical protein